MLKKGLMILILLGISQYAVASLSQDQLLKFTQEVKSAKGTFTQMIEGKGVESGEFAFKRPGRFLWQVNTPFKQISSSDGQFIYQYDPDLLQLIIRPVQLGSDQSPARVLFGDGAIDRKHFIFEDLPTEGQVTWVRAIPKTEDQGIRYVDIGFKQGELSQLRLKDSFDQMIEVTFNQIKENVVAPDSIFQINPPEGTDIIRLEE